MKKQDKKVYRCKFGRKIGCCQVECRHPKYQGGRRQYNLDHCEICKMFEED